MTRKTSVILDGQKVDPKEEIKRIKLELKRVATCRKEEMDEHKKQLGILDTEEAHFKAQIVKLEAKIK